ncbi:MAG: hypothetical protein GQ564_04055 [Bacteroidales bacterium]|nr:hypothetical protein [Bacteroidales bacterium]
MYRVAVVQNESEMQRTGYANVIAKLRTIHKFSVDYEFDLYTVVNLSNLFENGNNHLRKYDSLIITTNATSDKTVYNKLKNEKSTIEKFIEDGKGIFIASQKKLGKQENPTGFLPESYDFRTEPRPEESSEQGEISFFEKKKNHILLSYPNKIKENNINRQCENNQFMKHFYRSFVRPVDGISYTPILIDSKKYENKKERNLVMTNTFSKKRIVISTIVLDWAYHKEILTNIITFITEGLPQIAFVSKNNNSIKELFESAKILKKSHSTYNSLSSIDELHKHIHNIYILSSDYNDADINNFLNKIDSKNGFSEKRVYQIKEENDILKLLRHSKHSSIDKIIKNSVTWLKSQHSIGKGMWHNSFWTTFEILTLFDKLGMKLNDYIIPVLEDIKEHTNKGIDRQYNQSKYSYDGVVSTTCGFVRLLLLLREKKYEQSIFTDEDLKETIRWITEKERFKAQSPFDKRNIVLTLSLIQNLSAYDITKEQYSEMITNALQNKAGSAEYSEIEICQIISIYLLNQETNENEIKHLLKYLKNNQILGAWNSNIGRTAKVLIFLLQNFDNLKSKYINENDLADMVYRGILYLRSKCNNKNWGNEDIQATAKAAHAIFLNNERNRASMYDHEVLKIIEEENSEITYSEIIEDLTNNLREYSLSYNQLKKEKETLYTTNKTLKEEMSQLENIFHKKQTRNATITYSLIISVAILFTFLVKELIDINIYYSIIAGFITAIILGVANFSVQNFNNIKNKSKNKIQ